MSVGQGTDHPDAQIAPIYLNTDLEIEWTGDLSPLVAALAEQTAVLYNGPVGACHRVTLELLDTPAEASEAVSAICTLIENLSLEAANVWNAADLRLIDVGYESGIGKRFQKTIIEPSLLTRVAQLGAGLAVTVYPVMRELDYE